MKKLLFVAIFLPFITYAQNGSVFFPSGGGNQYLKPVSNLWGLLIPGLATSTTGCLSVTTSGWISASGSSCGGGSSSFSTTSANYWSTLGLGFSTTSADAWGLTKSYLTSAVTGLKQTYGAAQTGATQTLATSSDTNIGLTITTGTDTHTFTPTWIGTLADARITSASTWNGKQAGSASLTSLAALTYVSTAFVKLTGANTYTLDTNTYLTSLAGAASSTLLADQNTFSSSTITNFTSTRSTTTNATTTTASFTNASTTNLVVSGIRSALFLAGADGTASAYAGATCTNQFLRSITAAGAAGCASVNLASDLTGDLPFANLTQLGANTFLGNLTSATADASAISTSSFYAAGTAGNVLTYTSAGTWIPSATTTFVQGTGITLTVAGNAVTITNGGVVTESDPIVKAINGLVKSNGSAISAAVVGTDYTLTVAQSCSAGQHISVLTALGGSTCTADTGGGAAYPFVPTTSVFGTTTQATTSTEWFKQGLFASSTSYFDTIRLGTTTPQAYTNAALVIAGNVNSSVQVVAQNLSNGNAASTDFIATGDAGSDTTYYGDFGCNSSAYNQAAYNIGGFNSCYLYNNDGDLTIGTASTTNTVAVIKFFTGGTLSTKERVRIDANGLVGIGSSTPWAALSIATSTYPNFVIATTTAVTPQFFVSATSSASWPLTSDVRTNRDFTRISVATSTKGTYGLTDTFFVDGTINQDASYSACDHPAMSLAANITGNTGNFCGGFSFFVDTTGYLSTSTVASTTEQLYGALILGAGTPLGTSVGGVGARIGSSGVFLNSTSTAPNSLETWIMASTSSSTLITIGFSDSIGIQDTSVMPNNFVGYAASSTNNWQCISRKGQNEVRNDTGIASTTGGIQKLRVDFASSSVRCVINNATSTTLGTFANIPVVPLGVHISIASNAAVVGLTKILNIFRIRLWTR